MLRGIVGHKGQCWALENGSLGSCQSKRVWDWATGRQRQRQRRLEGYSKGLAPALQLPFTIESAFFIYLKDTKKF
jgi:hypothetical protein